MPNIEDFYCPSCSNSLEQESFAFIGTINKLGRHEYKCALCGHRSEVRFTVAKEARPLDHIVTIKNAYIGMRVFDISKGEGEVTNITNGAEPLEATFSECPCGITYYFEDGKYCEEDVYPALYTMNLITGEVLEQKGSAPIDWGKLPQKTKLIHAKHGVCYLAAALTDIIVLYGEYCTVICGDVVCTPEDGEYNAFIDSCTDDLKLAPK